MRRIVPFALAVMLAVSLTAAPAKALSDMTPRVPRDWDVTVGGDYNPGEAAPAAWGNIMYNAPQIGDEERVILDASTVAGEGVFAGIPSGTLMGLAYDLQLIDMAVVLDPQGAPQLYLYYGGMGRNPLDDLPADGSGGRFEIWEDLSIGAGEDTDLELFDPDLDAVPGGDHIAPWYWEDNAGGTAVPDVYPNVNDAADTGVSLWLQGYFAPLPGLTPNTQQPFVKLESLNLVSGEGQLADLNLVITAGSAATSLSGPNFVGAKLRYPPAAVYENTYADAGNWQVISDDPLDLVLLLDDPGTGYKTLSIGGTTYTFEDPYVSIKFDDASSLYAPEPATMSLLGMSLLGLAGAGLRKRKKK